jgi:hypothetical protein
VLILSISPSVFAAFPTEVEPNNYHLEANYILNNKALNGYIQSSGDMDWFRFRAATSALQYVIFIPPDNERYLIQVLDAEDMDEDWSAIAIVDGYAENGNSLYLQFYPTAGKEYYVVVMAYPPGHYNNTSPYTLILDQLGN